MEECDPDEFDRVNLRAVSKSSPKESKVKRQDSLKKEKKTVQDSDKKQTIGVPYEKRLTNRDKPRRSLKEKREQDDELPMGELEKLRS